MTIEVSDKQLAALVRGDAVAVGPSKRVITLDDGPFVVQRHHGPGPHPGTGTPQEVHGNGAGDEDYEWKPTVGEYALWTDNDQLVKITKEVDDEQVDIEIVSGPDRGGYFDGAFIDDLEEPDYDLIELWTSEDIDSTIARSKEIFGLTDDWSEAGYILDDGDMLDFSGKNQGGPAGTRSRDHREIGQAFEGDTPPYTEGMVWFMDKANAIRMSWQSDNLMVDFAGPPTSAQRNLIESIGTQSDAVYWDVSRWYDADPEAGTERHFVGIESGETSNDLEEIEEMLENIRTIYYKPDYEERSWIVRMLNQIINRGGPGSGFHGHVGRPKEVGGSAPVGTVGRPPLPAGGRDAPESQPRQIWKKNLTEPPTAETMLNPEEMQKVIEDMQAINNTLAYSDERTKRTMQAHLNRVSSALEMTLFNMESGDKESMEDGKARMFMDYVYELYWMTRFNIEHYGLGDQLSPEENAMMDRTGTMIDESDFVPGYSPSIVHEGDIEEAGDTEFDRWTEKWSESEQPSTWASYEAILPDDILNNPQMLMEAQGVVSDFSRRRSPSEELKPFYPGTDEDIKAYVSMYDYTAPIVQNIGVWAHPAVVGAVAEAWREQAMTEGTPEYYEAVKLGGVDPENRRFWIEGVTAMFAEPQWLPTDAPENQSEVADAINVGWVQNTSHPASILAMNAAARIFGDQFGTREVDLATHIPMRKDVRFGKDQEPISMLQEEAEDWINDSDRNATADQFINDIYENTQSYYLSKGLDPNETVPLYRGLNDLSDTAWNPTGKESLEVNDAEVNMWPISSWTLSESEARTFSRTGGAIVRAEVPINRILSNAQTGFPCNHEQEILVIGGEGLRGTVYSVKDVDDVILQGLSPIWTGGQQFDPSGEPYGNILDAALEGLSANIPVVTMRAVSMGGAFSLPSEMMTPELMRINMSPGQTIFVDEAGGADWMTDGLAKLGLDRLKVDGLEDPEEGDVSLEQNKRRKRANREKQSKKNQELYKSKKPMVQRSYPAPHCGLEGEVGGSAPRDECAAGTAEGVGTGAEVPSQRERGGFSHPLPNEDDLANWFETHNMPIDLVDVYAKQGVSQHRHAFNEEQLKRWYEAQAKDTERVLEELSRMDLKTLDKEKYLRTERRQELMKAVQEAEEKAAEAGDEEAKKYYSEIWSQLLFSTRQAEQTVNFAVRRAISNGELTPEEGAEIDKYDYGNFEGSRPWKPLPETLYHTTVAGSAIRETGLKSRFELGGEAAGLGGGNDQTVSYTDNPEWARAIERTIQEAQQVAAGEVTASDLIRNAAQGIGNGGKPFLTTMMSYTGMMFAGLKDEEGVTDELREYLNNPDFDPAVPIPEGLASEKSVRRAQDWINIYTSPDEIRTHLAKKDTGMSYFFDPDEIAEAVAKVTDERVAERTRDQTFQLYKSPYIYAREEAGGHLNPLIWGGDWQSFAKIDPNEIVTFQYKPKPGAMGGQMGALGEWRSYGSENVGVVDEQNLFYVSDLWTEKSLIQRAFDFVKRGGPGSGFKGHVGREGEVGGSAPEGTSSFNRPGMSAYGSGVFTPMLKDVIYGWQEQAGWNTAQRIYTNVVRAKEQGDEDYEGLAIGEDGILQGIGALDYNASHPDFEEQVALENPEFNIEDYLKIDGLYTPDPAFSEELIVQMAAEAAKNGKGIWMIVTDKSGPFAAQMGMSLVGEDYAYWTPEQVDQVAQKATGLEPVDYYAPPAKPRMLMSFDDAYTETMPENPITGQPAPTPISEMSVEERYRWENFNYSNWALPESWNPREMAKEQLGLGEEEEPSNLYDIRVSEDLENIHSGWIDGTTSPWSVRFSEAVAYVFGGEAIPESRPRHEYDTAQEFLDVLAGDFGADVIIPDDVDWYNIDEEEKWGILDEFNAFASGAREEDIATDLDTVVQSMYDTTQAKFKEAGYSPGDTVRLYRGLQSDPEERLNGHDGGWANVKQWAVSSWTAAKVVAGNFATMEGEASTIEETGTLLTADIPIEKILSNWQTGPGSHGEFEYLVLGKDTINAYATKAYSKRMYRDAKEGVAIDHGKDLSDLPEYALGPEIE